VLPAVKRQTALAVLGYVLSPEQHATFRGRVNPAEDVEQCALTRAGRAQDDDEFLFRQLHVNAPQREDLYLAEHVDLFDADDLEQRRLPRLRHWESPCRW